MAKAQGRRSDREREIMKRYAKHGHNRVGHQSATYRSWRAMVQRCTNTNAANFGRFGGRSITVCERWRKFKNFLADLGPRPRNKTLGRIFDLMPYEPEMAIWQTTHQQTMHRLAHQFFMGKVRGWSSRKLRTVIKFIVKTMEEDK
jgi:hypothetical protein